MDLLPYQKILSKILFNAVQDAILIKNPLPFSQLIDIKINKKKIYEIHFRRNLLSFVNFIAFNPIVFVNSIKFVQLFCFLFHLYLRMNTPKKLQCALARNYLTQEDPDLVKYLFLLNINKDYFTERIKKELNAFDKDEPNNLKLLDFMFAD